MRRFMLRDSGVASSRPVPSVLALNPKATFENGFSPICFGADASVGDFLPRRLGFGNTSMLIAGAVAASNEAMVVCACDGRLQASRASGIRITASFVCSMIGPFLSRRVELELRFKGRTSKGVRRCDGLQLVSDRFHFFSTNFSCELIDLCASISLRFFRGSLLARSITAF